MTTKNRRLKHDLSGVRFGLWTAVEHTSHGFWTCQCECGSVSKVNGKALRSGSSKSCGCRKAEVTRRKSFRHGHTSNRKPSPEYNAYQNMLKRCRDPKNEKYPQYGGRGITVCERWLASFENFFADMGPRPSRNHSLDREDVNGHYEKINCRWATAEVQSRNKTTTITVGFEGNPVSLVEACEALGLKYGTIHNRITRLGMTFAEAIRKKPKLSEEQVRQIRKTTPYRGVKVDLAKKYGVSDALIGQIMRGEAWSRYSSEPDGVTPEEIMNGSAAA